MATSSGNSSGSSQVQISGSAETLMNERKRKRMQSNRESARRSRMRKQKQLDDLNAQMAQLKKENNQILTSINITTQHCLNVEAENSILNAQMMELDQRLQSLNDIISYMNTANGMFETEELQASPESFMNNINQDPWNLMCFNQPIMASADIFQY